MNVKTSIADQYLLEHFYETCSQTAKRCLHCNGVEGLGENYSWLDVLFYGDKKCGSCEFRMDGQGFYDGNGVFSRGFESQKYVSLNHIRTQEEFESVCDKINQDVQGIVIRGAVANAAPLEKFKKLEFVVLSDQKIEHFWDMSQNPCLRILSIYGNHHLKSLKGLENAENLECIQFLSHIASVNTVKVDSFAPIANLPKLKEVIISATEPLDHNMDYLIGLEALEYLWISPNLFPMECYAKFEAKKFMLSQEYGIYLEEDGDILPYGKGKRVMHTAEQKEKYLREYRKLLGEYQ